MAAAHAKEHPHRQIDRDGLTLQQVTRNKEIDATLNRDIARALLNAATHPVELLRAIRNVCKVFSSL